LSGKRKEAYKNTMNFHNLKNKIAFVSGFLMILMLNGVYAQMEYPGIPEGIHHMDKAQIAFTVLPSAGTLFDQYLAESNQGALYKKDVFAGAVSLHISPSTHGNWHSAGEYRIWQLGITSGQASSINLIFDPFHLLPGSKLFIYSPDMKSVYGAYTFRNNKSNKVLAISPLMNDSLIIELQVLKNAEGFGGLTLAKAGVGFPGESGFKDTEDRYYGWSADCHTDVNCEISEAVQRQKYAVCRIIFNGTTRCTGTLMNNTSVDGRPFVLTAGHCIMDNSDAGSAIYFFDYESPYCDGPDGSPLSISGSDLLSRGYIGDEGLDFSLVRMSERPPADYYPLYAGWDTRELAFDSVYTMHHPEGDVKKISVYNDQLQTGTFPPFNSYTHWLVPKYDLGSTETGSSGAALFNSQNRVVGTLSGGNVVCTEYINDLYQKFSRSWDEYPDDSQQLKEWLDPLNSGSQYLDAYALVDPLFSVSELFSNAEPGETFSAQACSTGWGYISGHNHLQNSEYAEHFEMNGTKYLYALYMDVAKRHFSAPDSKIKIKVWSGSNYPGDLLYEKDLYYFELLEGQENFIRLDSIIHVDREFYIGYEIFYRTPADTFAVYTTASSSPEKINSAFYRGNEGWLPLTDGENSYITSLSLRPVVMNYFPHNKLYPRGFPVDEVTLYPNPTYGDMQVLFESAPSEIVEMQVFDLTGRLVLEATEYSPEPNFILNTNNLSTGSYILKIANGDMNITLNFVKL
jgi:hypothetical protein